jgi:serine phosphatase RsbU (regulator of sigma subunit)
MKLFSLFFLFFSQLPHLAGQPANLPVRNYSLSDYGRLRSSQNLCILQDQKGLLYFGNANGLLQFDGKNWEFINVKEGAYVTSMAMDSSGTIYVGSQSEFGFLETTGNGKLSYRSLMPLIKEKDRDFGRVMSVCVTAGRVIFQSQEKIFIRLPDSSLKVISPATTFHTSFSVKGNYYVRERQSGLLRLNGDVLEMISGSEIFSDRGIFCMTTIGSHGEILIGTMELGLWKYNPAATNENERFSPFKTSSDELIAAGIYGGQRLSNGSLAFNTLSRGVFILDSTGKTIALINKDNGLRVDDVKFLFEDRQQNLWLALNNGISKVAYNSPISFYSDESGLTGAVHQVIRYDNSLYVASSSGLFKRNETGSEAGDRFIKISGVEGQIWCLVPTPEGLVAAGDEGVYILAASSIKKVSTVKCRSLIADDIHEAWLIGNEQGLFIYDRRWLPVKKTEDIQAGIVSLKPDPSSGTKNETVVWAGTLQEGVFRISIGGDFRNRSEWIGFPDGLSNEFIRPFALEGQIVFGTSVGVYRYNKKNKFELASFLDGLVIDEQVTEIYPAQEKVWLSIANQVMLYDRKKGTALAVPFLAIDKGQVHCFFQEGGICWIGADDGLIRYEVNNKKEFGSAFNAMIRKVSFGRDSVTLFGNATMRAHDKAVPKFDYALNSLSVEYIGLFYEDPHKNMYSFRLEGHDTTWSKWSPETKAVFTNLREGAYTFMVRCRNVYGTVSSADQFSFAIAAPWYRTWWAYLGYAAALVAAVFLFIRMRTKQLLKEKVLLEKTVQERTAEVMRQKDVIEEQKHLVEHKHREITDSINYAERIQHTFLASTNLLDQYLKDYFVFFQPKDVVSGDFYWAAVLSNGQFALVTADSTGHGVPGAIMSILNITCLEATVEEEKISAPSLILDHTRGKIIDRLKKDGSAEGGKDGMDCSVVSFDFKAMQLTYAAANNPVWIVRREQQTRELQLLELSPDKMPAGKHDRDHVPFSQHHFALYPGDMIYTLTDGLPDQFGGEKGKKFKHKKLKELLLSMSGEPVKVQKTLLQTAFMEWKGHHEQVDDVTLIGIRI